MRRQVYEILLMPIECDKYKYSKIYRKDNVLYTGQRYISKYSDADMSDLAVHYYEIVYSKILEGKRILQDNGDLVDSHFAGDTMNSFNTVANRVPGAGKSRKQRKSIPSKQWPKYLQEYELNYHCLANFWILPLDIGRTLKPLSKARVGRDYMDRFLNVLCSDIKLYEDKYEPYFMRMGEFVEFADIHFLVGNNLKENMQIEVYSTPINNGEEFIQRAQAMMRHRADLISKSECAESLWDYFNKLGILQNP